MFPRCPPRIVRMPVWVLKRFFFFRFVRIWFQWEPSLSIWMRRVTRSCQVRVWKNGLGQRKKRKLPLWSPCSDRTAPILEISYPKMLLLLGHFPMSIGSLCERRSLILLVSSARCSENLLSWLTMSRNFLTSFMFWGGGRSAITCSFSRSASIPLKLMTCRRNCHVCPNQTLEYCF